MQSSEETNEKTTEKDAIKVAPVKKDEGTNRIYELGYLLVPTLEVDALSAVVGDLKDLINASFKGEIISDDMPKSINLAYTMTKVVNNVRSKYDTAYFGWVKFAMEPEQVLELKKKLDLDPKMIRFLITKTVRENTIATKRYVPRAGSKPYNAKKTDEPVVAMDKEKVDQEIDALISI